MALAVEHRRSDLDTGRSAEYGHERSIIYFTQIYEMILRCDSMVEPELEELLKLIHKKLKALRDQNRGRDGDSLQRAYFMQM